MYHLPYQTWLNLLFYFVRSVLSSSLKGIPFGGEWLSALDPVTGDVRGEAEGRRV